MVQATRVPAGAVRSKGIKRLALGVVMAVVGTVAVSAWAQGHGPRGGGDFGGPGLFMGQPERVAHGVDRLLEGLNATEAQRSQIKQIVLTAAADLAGQRESARALRAQGLQLFTAPVVDARAVEALRQQTLAQHDQTSKRVTQALLDISAVLSPEQRAKLAERIKQRAEHRREHRGEHHRGQRGAASAPAQ